MAYRVLHQWLYGKRRKREAAPGFLDQLKLQPSAKAGLLDMDVGIYDSKFRVNRDKSAVYVVAKASSKIDCQIIDQLAGFDAVRKRDGADGIKCVVQKVGPDLSLKEQHLIIKRGFDRLLQRNQAENPGAKLDPVGFTT